MLEIYSGIFNAVEGNTTFHALPTLGRLKTWAARTPERFEFFVKFPRSITHDKKLYRTDEDILRFLSLLKGIKSKVGTLMIQLPPSFDPSLLDRILRLKEILPTEFTYAIEFRHPDFFANPNLEIFDLVKTRCFQPGVFG
jgi:uncharacterized protein YecE (DUF72 family)